MKKMDFNIVWTDNKSKSGVSEWKNMDLSADNITNRLSNELNSNEKLTEVKLALTFKKSEFDIEFVESLMTVNSEIIEDTDEEIEIIWSLYK